MELDRRHVMVNFRFHLVSLTAVFFALALGVTVGATVLERTTVDTLESQVNRVAKRADETDRLNAALRAEVDLRDAFAEQLGDRHVEGRLVDVPVVLLGVEGVDPAALDGLRTTLTVAGARIDAVVVFRQKIMLDEEGDATQLAELLESTATRPGTLRRQLFSALSTSWMTGTAHDLLELLNTGGFVGYERLDPSGDDTTTTELLPAQPVEPAPELRFVLISDDGVEVPNDDLAVPLLEELARGGERLVLAAEPGEADEEGVFRAEFVSELRTRQSLAGLISTIDNVGTFIGRTAAVLAVADLGSGRLGHYGRGRGAETLVPPSPAE